MRYEIVAEAYRDLERSSGRIVLIERLAELFRQTPDELVPTVALLCQGQIAPDFAGVELGMAERLAARAVAQAVGTTGEQVLAGAREVGDLGLTAEQLLQELDPERAATLEVGVVFEGLHEIARAEGEGSLGAQAGRDGRAAGAGHAAGGPLPGPDRDRQPAAGDRDRDHPGRAGGGACRRPEGPAGAGAGLQHLFRPQHGRGHPGPRRRSAVEAIQVRAGNPVRPMLAQRMSESAEILAKLGGTCAAEYKYDGIRVQAHRTADGVLELYTRRLDRVSTQFPEVVELLDRSLGPREVILEGEVVAADPASGELRPFQDVMFRRRKYGIAEATKDFPVSMFCFELLYADGTDLTRLPYLERRARLAEAITPSPRLLLTTAEQVSDEATLEATFEQAVAEGCEGLICKSVDPAAQYQAGARGWQWIKLKRDYRSELTDTLDLVVVGGLAGRGRRAGMYGALLLGVYDPAGERFQTICKCGTGFSDAELAGLPARLAPLARAQRPARVDSRWAADVWFEPTLVVEVLAAELTLSPHHTAGWGLLKEDAGLALRFPRFTGRWRDDKAPTDATTVEEAIAMYRTARRLPADG